MALHFHFGSSSLGIAYCFQLPIEKTVFHRRDIKKRKIQIFVCFFPVGAPVNTAISVATLVLILIIQEELLPQGHAVV